MYLQKDKVETLSAKEILTCGLHRIPQNQLCSKTYTLFGPAIFKPKKKYILNHWSVQDQAPTQTPFWLATQHQNHLYIFEN